MTIAGKAVLVTGANRGIGQALVEEALSRGARRVYAGPLSRPCGAPGAAGGSFAGQQARQPNIGPGRPRECALSGGRRRWGQASRAT